MKALSLFLTVLMVLSFVAATSAILNNKTKKAEVLSITSIIFGVLAVICMYLV